MTDKRHFCPNARNSEVLRLCCGVCQPLCEICGVRKSPPSRLTQPGRFLYAESPLPWKAWKHLVWVIPAVAATLAGCLYLWIVFIAWAIKLADALGWLP